MVGIRLELHEFEIFNYYKSARNIYYIDFTSGVP